MSADLHDLGFLEVAEALTQKRASSEELTMALLARSEELEPKLNSLTWFNREAVLAEARAADAALSLIHISEPTRPY